MRRLRPTSENSSPKSRRRDFAQIRVDVVGNDRLRFARIVEIREEHFAREVAAACDGAREPPILDRQRMFDAALAAKA